jgi:alpha/beta superfamily hydrolase
MGREAARLVRVRCPIVLSTGRYDVAAAEEAWLGAVVLHPHPRYGGDRHNIVVQALFDALPAAGVAAVRFDFDSDDIAAGAADAVAAIDLLPASGGRVVVVGYSFGALVAGQVIDERVSGWVLVAPPLGMVPGGDAASIGSDERPKLVLTPEHDQFCPPEAARQATVGWPATEAEAVSGADHFLAGATARVAERVIAWVSRFRPAGR